MTIVKTKECCGGEPRIEGHRITIVNILGYLAGEMTIQEICEDFQLTKEEVIEAINWAKEFIEVRG